MYIESNNKLVCRLCKIELTIDNIINVKTKREYIDYYGKYLHFCTKCHYEASLFSLMDELS